MMSPFSFLISVTIPGFTTARLVPGLSGNEVRLFAPGLGVPAWVSLRSLLPARLLQEFAVQLEKK